MVQRRGNRLLEKLVMQDQQNADAIQQPHRAKPRRFALLLQTPCGWIICTNQTVSATCIVNTGEAGCSRDCTCQWALAIVDRQYQWAVSMGMADGQRVGRVI